jgi:hypothetical protein
VFVIRLLDGEEVHAAEGDKLSVNQQTGVLSVHRIDGFEEVTTHYSPSAWASVTHRVKEPVVRPSLVGNDKEEPIDPRQRSIRTTRDWLKKA